MLFLRTPCPCLDVSNAEMFDRVLDDYNALLLGLLDKRVINDHLLLISFYTTKFTNTKKEFPFFILTESRFDNPKNGSIRIRPEKIILDL